jgi:quercetin dioxygenase-like cupin family protein
MKALKIAPSQNTPQEKEECCTKTKIRWLINTEIGEQNTLRLFEMFPGGYSPLHKHAWEHSVFVLKRRFGY